MFAWNISNGHAIAVLMHVNHWIGLVSTLLQFFFLHFFILDEKNVLLNLLDGFIWIFRNNRLEVLHWTYSSLFICQLWKEPLKALPSTAPRHIRYSLCGIDEGARPTNTYVHICSTSNAKGQLTWILQHEISVKWLNCVGRSVPSCVVLCCNVIVIVRCKQVFAQNECAEW